MLTIGISVYKCKLKEADTPLLAMSVQRCILGGRVCFLRSLCMLCSMRLVKPFVGHVVVARTIDMVSFLPFGCFEGHGGALRWRLGCRFDAFSVCGGPPRWALAGDSI
jgi:hypothetical protein